MSTSHRPLNRRTFLEATAAAGAASWGLAGRPARADEPTGKPAAGKIGDFKVSLAEWSLHKALFAKKIDNLDFPKIAREQYGIEGVEFVNQFFKDKAHDSAYLKELKSRASDVGVTCVLIMIDGEGDLSAPDATARNKAVDNHKKWVDAAAALGCHAIRVNTGEHYSPTDVGAVAEACTKLTEYGESRRISIICENHGGPSSNPDAMVALMKAVNRPTFGTLPDFGNFPHKKGHSGPYMIDVYDAIARMMPYARGVSAKSYDFDASGRETMLDYARILKIVTDAGYHGFVGIEYEGSRLGEPEGIKATRDLLLSLRGANYQPAG
ncbi:MAG: sugar phosphate isomerase/epimerase family protein [Isosphaeraceae bacterium]